MTKQEYANRMKEHQSKFEELREAIVKDTNTMIEENGKIDPQIDYQAKTIEGFADDISTLLEQLAMPCTNREESGVPIKNWYVENFPSDDEGMNITNTTTFADLYAMLINGKGDIYKLIGVADSVIRERLFTRLSYLTNMEYNDIYELWLALD